MKDEEVILRFRYGMAKWVGKLIRCKDCRFYDGYSCHNKWYGDGFGWYAPPAKTEEGFCDWAERREGDESD